MWICVKQIIIYTWKYQINKLITIKFNRNRKFTLELSEIGNTPITFFFGDIQVFLLKTYKSVDFPVP
jgi:hypothetical protein